MNEQLVEDWIRYHSKKPKQDDPLFAAWEQVHEIVERDPEAGWLLILKLIDVAPNDGVLAAVAAGPLEDLICRSPELFIDRVELHARRDPKFRRCLTGVWTSRVSPNTRERIAKYASTVKDPL